MKSLYLPVFGGTFAALSTCGRAKKQILLSNNGARTCVAAIVLLIPAFGASAQPAPATETARSSKLAGISFGAVPERDLRPEAISSGADYLAQLAKQADPASKVSDVEVIFWRNAVKPQAVAAYQKLLTDNLAKAGYTYKVTGTQTDVGQTTTLFTAESEQQGRIIGYWQGSPQGLYLNWGHSSGAAAAPLRPAAPAVDPSAAAPAGTDKDAEIAQLKKRLAELDIAKTPPAGPATPDHSAPAAPKAPGTTAAAQAPDKTPLVALERSDLVSKDPQGALLVADKTGRGVDGIKLSQHDRGIASPSIAVAPDGTIHVTFVESHRTTYAYAVYHRSSSDGGKTWTEAKNLSEEMVNFDVGQSQVLVDSHDRVYVIWHAGLAEGAGAIGKDRRGERANLWFRVLEGGKWSKTMPIGETCTQPTVSVLSAAYSSYAGVDASGNVEIIWNVWPDLWHPELLSQKAHSPGAGTGLVFQSTLNGPVASKPREVFLAVSKPAVNGSSYPSCEDLDMLNGYFDSAGEAHFIAEATGPSYSSDPHKPCYELIENGKAGQKIVLPELSAHAGKDVPTLLVDAKGKRHLIALFLAGEHPNIRDYLLGSDDEPTVIRAAVGLNGGIMGFQACQGPGGRMVVLMQMNDTGEMHSGDNFVSMSTGDGKWSVPVNMTNNKGRKTFHNTQTSAQSNLGQITACLPGQCAAAFDKDGHLVVVLIKGEYKIVLATAFGFNTAGGDVTIPTLRFLKF